MYDFCTTSRKIYMVRRSKKMPLLNRFRIQQAGLPFMRRVAGYLKPTTEAAQRFGFAAKKNIIELHENELKRLCVEGEVRGAWQGADCGYVFLKTASWIWGCGLFLDPGRVVCQLPKSMKRWFAGKL